MNARFFRIAPRSPYGLWLGPLAVTMLLASAAPAAAQISAGAVNTWAGATEVGSAIRATDSAYDPVNDRSLIVGTCYGACSPTFGMVYGFLVNRAGVAVTAKFPIRVGGPGGHAPRARYFSNGTQRGFLVVWAEEGVGTGGVYVRVITPDGVPAGPERLVSDAVGAWLEGAPAIAYSATSGRFLVVWAHSVLQFVAARLLDTTGAPIGGILNLSGSGFTHAYYTSVTWNSGTNQFGVSFGAENDGSGVGYSVFAQVSPVDGSFARQTFNQFSVGVVGATDIDYNPDTNRYVMAWWQGARGTPAEIRVAEIDTTGAVVTTGMITRTWPGYNSLGVAFNQASRTFLLGGLGSSDEAAGIELNRRGFEISSATAAAGVKAFYPRVSASLEYPEWTFVFSDGYAAAKNVTVTTAATAGGPHGNAHPAPGVTAPPPPGPTPTPPSSGGCSTPDPFVTIGGGTCIGGGWIPGGGSNPTPPPPAPPPPTPPPPTSQAGCNTPDPFAAIGGGTCLGNDAWIPGAPIPTPPPSSPPPSSPPPSAPPPPPPTSSAGCAGSDPFVTIGGGACVNGNWIPASLVPSCPGPDPFAAIGGGVCANGAWFLPGTTGAPTGPATSPGGCVGPDPFVTIGGGTCVGGNWIPNGGEPSPEPESSLATEAEVAPVILVSVQLRTSKFELQTAVVA